MSIGTRWPLTADSLTEGVTRVPGETPSEVEAIQAAKRDIDAAEAPRPFVYLVTGDGHGEACRAELRRVAALGSKAAARELEQEEWHRRAERAARAVEPRLSFAEAREAIAAVAGKPPHGNLFSGRAMLVWLKRSQGQ